MVKESRIPVDVPGMGESSEKRPEQETICDEVPFLVRTFVSSRLSEEDRLRLRTHVEECADCRDLYRSGVETAAHIGREHREERVETERMQRRHSLKKDAMAAGSPLKRRSPIRTLLYPAFFFFLILQITNFNPNTGTVELEVIAGEVHGSEHVERGEYCRTGSDGVAVLRAGKDEARLEPNTAVFLEDNRPRRLRLLEGELALDGEWRITTALGVIDVNGIANLSLREGHLDCEAFEGDVRRIDASGTRHIPPGTALGQ